MATLDDLEAMLGDNLQKVVRIERGKPLDKIVILVDEKDSEELSVGRQLLDMIYTRLVEINHVERMSEVEKMAREIFEEDSRPCLRPFYKIAYNEDGDLIFSCDYLSMSMGAYDEEEEIEYCLREIEKELIAELPKELVIQISDGEPSVLQTIPTTGGPVFQVLDLEMTEGLRTDLMKMVEAQGGAHKPYGYFRFDPELLEQHIVNCPHCGTLWKARTDNPVRCQVCQRPLSSTTKRLTHREGIR